MLLRVWYLIFFAIYLPTVASNLFALLALQGPDALSNPKNLSQALLVDQFLRLLAQRPLIALPILAAVTVLIGLGRLAHLDADRERDEQERRLRQVERDELTGVVVDAARREGRRAGARGAQDVLSSQLAPSPDLPSVEPLGPPFDVDVLPRSGHFVGRSSELDTLLRSLRAGGATSITAVEGMGGIGKTTLAAQAIQFLRAEADSFPGGIGVVKGQGKTDATQLIREALARFDPFRRQPTATTDEELQSAARRLLGGKKALIVIDNVEPGLDIERVVAPLIAAGATILITARHHIPIGTTLPLDLLPARDAVELFAQEYGAGPASDLSTPQRAAVERIVKELGYLTLAVKLAAKYAADDALDLGTLADVLADPLRIIEIPDRVQGSVQESMAFIYSKSASSLNPKARRLFEGFSAFPTADFGLKAGRALAAVLGIGEDEQVPFIDLLERRALISRSRLDHLPDPASNDADRIQLHPVLSAFSRQGFDGFPPALHEVAYVAVAQHYARYCNQAKREAKGPDALNIEGALTWALDHQKDEVVAAICAGMVDYWRDYGLKDARQRYLPLGLAAAGRAQHKQKRGDADTWLASLKLGYAQWLRFQGERKEAQRTSRGVLRAFKRLGNLKGQGSTLVLYGNLARDDGKYQLAERYLKQALPFFITIEDNINVGLVYSFLGQVARKRGTRLEQADGYLDEARKAYEAENNQWGKGLMLQQLGQISLQRGRYEQARDRFGQALAIDQALQARRPEGVAVSALGQVAAALGQFADAERFYLQSLAIRRETGDKRGEAIDLTLLGQLDRLRRHLDPADSWLQQALAQWERLREPPGLAWAQAECGLLALARGHLAEAEPLLREALAGHRGVQDARAEVIALTALGHIARERGRLSEAEKMLGQAVTLVRETEDRPQEARVMRETAALAEKQGNLGRAGRLYRESLALARGVGAPLDIADAQLDLGRFLAQGRDNPEEGYSLLTAAARAYAALGLPEEQKAQELARTIARGA